MTKPNDFNWEAPPQLSLPQTLLAFAVPSALACVGFHLLLPLLVENQVPALVAWPLVATPMLLGLVVFAAIRLSAEAKALNVSNRTRMCLRPLTGKEWGICALIMVGGLVFASGANQLVGPLMGLLGVDVPAYMPFFLDPSVDPMAATAEELSPGFPLSGQFFLIPLFALALLLNVLAEEFYFRAWLLPKMSSFGSAAWVANAVLFAAYHIFQFWLFPPILVGSLMWAFMINRTKSITPALAGHLIANSLTLVGMMALIVS